MALYNVSLLILDLKKYAWMSVLQTAHYQYRQEHGNVLANRKLLLCCLSAVCVVDNVTARERC